MNPHSSIVLSIRFTFYFGLFSFQFSFISMLFLYNQELKKKTENPPEQLTYWVNM